MYRYPFKSNLLSAVSEVAHISALSYSFCSCELHIHNVRKDIVHTAHILCEFGTALIGAQLADTAFVIVITKLIFIISR